MRVALDAARNAIASGDIPVGAAIFNSRGEIVSIGHNERELHQNILSSIQRTVSFTDEESF